jgi:hypothetical protein
MFDQPLTVGALLVVNGATILPLIVLLARGVWYLSKMAQQHDQMWQWFVRMQQPPPQVYRREAQ